MLNSKNFKRSSLWARRLLSRVWNRICFIICVVYETIFNALNWSFWAALEAQMFKHDTTLFSMFTHNVWFLIMNVSLPLNSPITPHTSQWVQNPAKDIPWTHCTTIPNWRILRGARAENTQIIDLENGIEWLWRQYLMNKLISDSRMPIESKRIAQWNFKIIKFLTIVEERK